MTSKKRTILIVAGIIVLVLIELAASNAYLNYKRTGSWGFSLPGITWKNPFAASRPASPDMLAITEPVHDVTGTVLKVADGMVRIKINPKTNQSADTVQTTDKNASPIEFNVHVTDSTNIIKDMPPIPYLYAPSPTPPSTDRPVTPPGTGLKLTDLSPGQIIAVTSSTDLRTLASDEFDASMIRITVANAIHGTITAINGNTISLSGTYLESATPTEPQDYSIAVRPTTEISYQIPSDPAKNTPVQNHKLTVGNLKPGTEITVFINADAQTHRSADALLIQPLLTSDLIGDSTPPGTDSMPPAPAASAAANAQTP